MKLNIIHKQMLKKLHEDFDRPMFTRIGMKNFISSLYNSMYNQLRVLQQKMPLHTTLNQNHR